MICEVCNKKNADIVFKTVTGNQVATKAMCMGCAHSMQQDMIKMFMALGFRQDQMEQNLPQGEESPAMPRYLCTQCGRPYEEINEHTMAGCASCYEAMRADLSQHLKADHLQAEQVGEEVEPASPGQAEDELSRLRYAMMEAIIKEHYEEAAQLRDQITSLELAADQP